MYVTEALPKSKKLGRGADDEVTIQSVMKQPWDYTSKFPQ